LSVLTQDVFNPFEPGRSIKPSGYCEDTMYINNHSDMLVLMSNQAECFKCTPSQFLDWLTSQDVLTLMDLYDACLDPDFCQVEMTAHGLKKFKRHVFVRAVQAAAAATDTLTLTRTAPTLL
jgi:hypothetical protein